MQIDFGERIAAKHDGSTVIIEEPPNIKQNLFTMWYIYMKNHLFILAIVVHCIYILCDEMFINLQRPGHTFAVAGARAI